MFASFGSKLQNHISQQSEIHPLRGVIATKIAIIKVTKEDRELIRITKAELQVLHM